MFLQCSVYVLFKDTIEWNKVAPWFLFRLWTSKIRMASVWWERSERWLCGTCLEETWAHQDESLMKGSGSQRLVSLTEGRLMLQPHLYLPNDEWSSDPHWNINTPTYSPINTQTVQQMWLSITRIKKNRFLALWRKILATFQFGGDFKRSYRSLEKFFQRNLTLWLCECTFLPNTNKEKQLHLLWKWIALIIFRWCKPRVN